MPSSSDKVLEWPDWLAHLERLPAYWGEIDTKWAPLFKDPPDLLVMHSGAYGNWLAEYFSVDRGRVAAAHICYYSGLLRKLPPGTEPPKYPNTFVQCVSLRRSAPGAGGSVCQGRGAVNARSIHIELPARPKDTEAVRGQLQGLLRDLVVALPSLEFYTEHKVIDPWRKVGGKGRGRTDPVKSSGWDRSWMEGSGLVWAGRQAQP